MVKEANQTGKFSADLTADSVTRFTFDGTEKHGGKAENVRHYKCRVETPEGGDVMLDVKFVHDIPDKFDMQAFLEAHVVME